MNHIAGNECPTCGCPDGEVIRHFAVWGMPYVQLVCDHCGKTWRTVAEVEPEPDAGDDANGVVYHVMRCPKCSSRDTHVTRTLTPVRYHKCDACGYTFKSVEE